MPPLTSDEIERVEAIKHDELVDARIPIRRSLWRVVTDGSKTEEQREWCWTVRRAFVALRCWLKTNRSC